MQTQIILFTYICMLVRTEDSGGLMKILAAVRLFSYSGLCFFRDPHRNCLKYFQLSELYFQNCVCAIIYLIHK